MKTPSLKLKTISINTEIHGYEDEKRLKSELSGDNVE